MPVRRRAGNRPEQRRTATARRFPGASLLQFGGMEETPGLNEAAVGAALTTRRLGRRYIYLPEVGSTNDRLKELVAAGPAGEPPAGAVVLADYQSAGRGRLNRRWDAPPGSSLLFSVLFRPGWPAEQAGLLTMLAGVAVAEAVEGAIDRPVALKWPNDLVIEIGGVWRKVCGLLLDSSLDAGGHLTTAILGVGLNVNVPADVLPEAVTPPTSLMIVTGRPVARLPLLATILARLEARYDAAEAGAFPWEAWNRRLITLGREVVAGATGDSTTAISGLAEATDEWGRLIVRDAAGRRHTIAAGDVTLRSG